MVLVKTGKRIITSALLLITAVWTVDAEHPDKYFLDNYRIPVGKCGATVGHIVPTPGRIRILEDTSSLFRMDKKSGTVQLKKGKAVASESSVFRFGIKLSIDGEPVSFELLKDGFSTNKVVAHRGVWKKEGVLQNSMRSFQNAVKSGCEGSEFDVRLTLDKKVVLSHDARIYGIDIENTSSGEIVRQTAQKPDPVPFLEDVLKYVQTQNTTSPVIEIKKSRKGMEWTLELTDSIVSIVHRMKMNGYVKYISFSYQVLERIRTLDPTAPLFYLSADKKLSDLENARIMGIDYNYGAYYKNRNLIKEARDRGMEINVWTVNRPEDMLYFKNQGVDYITTDEPELLMEVMRK